ncbi:hypothetical protein ACFL6C_01020 [Myxococcota bacterium]
MSSLYSTQDAKSVGKGKHSPAGSLTDKELSQMVSGYKRGVASRYRALVPDEIDVLPGGKLLVSPKIDGEQWCLVMDAKECFLANPRGRVLSGKIPVLDEAKKCISRIKGRTVVAGELYAMKGGRRPRHGDLAASLAGEAKANVDRVRFAAFDLVAGGDDKGQVPLMEYGDRLDVLERVFKSTKLVQVVNTEKVDGNKEVARLFKEWVESGDSEGLVARAEGGITYKVKPAVTIDAAVIGYTLRSEDETQVSSFLLALIREDGNYQLVGHCGNVGNEHERRKLLKEVQGMAADSNFREASSRGALYRFVHPKIVAEVIVSDVQAEKADGDIMPRMVLSYEKKEWKALQVMPGVSLLHPRLVRLRDDKETKHDDIPISQVLDRVLLPDAHSSVAALELKSSKLLKREVYTKTTKGSLAVRKLVMWETQKNKVLSDFPAFVVHWTDYSSGRKDPLKRTVRLAPTKKIADEIAEEMIASEIKRGWERAK